MRKIIINSENISQFWVVCVMIIYGLLISEYFTTLNSKIFEIQASELTISPLYFYIKSFNFTIMLLISFIVWLISSFLFHLLAILLGGESTFRKFLKYTGLCYIIPLIGFIIAIVVLEKIKFPKENINYFLTSNKLMILINWIISISSTLCFILPIAIIKYLYQLNWLKAFGAIVISLFTVACSTYVFGGAFRFVKAKSKALALQNKVSWI